MNSKAKEEKTFLSRPDLASQIDERDSITFDIDKALDILSDLSEKLISDAPEQFINRIPQKACELLSAPIGILWQFDEEEQKFIIVASWGEVDEEYKKSKLDLQDEEFFIFFSKTKTKF